MPIRRYYEVLGFLFIILCLSSLSAVAHESIIKNPYFDAMMSKITPQLAASYRKICAAGMAQALIDEMRREGRDLPDVVDLCIMALMRSARDGRLLTIYEEGAPSEGAAKLYLKSDGGVPDAKSV